MPSFDTLKTADYSPLVVHFTKTTKMHRSDLILEDNPLSEFSDATARSRLESILKSRTIHASPMPFAPGNPSAVCVTECVWEALTRLAESYSSFGIVFNKRLIFEKGGGPALYIRGDHQNELADDIPEDLYPFISPFDPEAALKPGVRLDWLYEREWRLPSSLNFEYSDISYVLVESIEDADAIVHLIGAQNLPEEKLIPLDVYRHIKSAWSPD